VAGSGPCTDLLLRVVLGVLTMVLAVIDFGRSREHWLLLLALILGLLTFAPVIGFTA
jgi:hypothetical protein